MKNHLLTSVTILLVIWVTLFNICGSAKAAPRSWSGWIEVPGGGTTTSADNAVVYNGKIYLFVVGSAHGHWVNIYN